MTLANTTSQTLTAGAGYGNPVKIYSIPATINAVPGSGGTMLVQYTSSSFSSIDAGTANWTNWPAGSVSSQTSDSALGPITGIKASATTANGTLEVCQ